MKEKFISKWLKRRILLRLFPITSQKPDKTLDRFKDSIQSAEVFIDGGANSGSVTRLALKWNDNPKFKVFAFEPDPIAFQQLESLSDSRLSKFNQALWIEEGEMPLYRHKNFSDNQSTTSSTLIKSKTNVDSESFLSVKTRNFANFLRGLNVSSRIVIKLDIEGAEYQVLGHLVDNNLLKRVHLVYCEFHAYKIRFGVSRHLLLWLRLWISGNARKVTKWF